MISILLPDLRGGGAERVNIDLAHEFVRTGHEVEFVLMRPHGELLNEARKSFSLIDLAAPRARNIPLTLARYLRRRRPDALLVAMWPLTVIAPLAVFLSGHRCKVVVSEHNSLSLQYREWGLGHRAALRTSMVVGYRFVDRRVGVSSGVAADIAALSGLPLDAFDRIHNPVPSRPKLSDEAIQDAEVLWSAPKGARVVTVGSMKAQKNHPLLLGAFAQMSRPDARLMFVGTGAGEADLRALADDLGVASQVIFAGFHPDPTPFYQTADLFVLSSDYEGFGNVIVEALACGTPVVSTDCPSGPAEILEDGKYGRLVPVRDSQALADAMQDALTTSHDPALLKQRASEFAPEIAAKRYLELLCP
ncbi:glycosyltransferase [Sulfitobacter sp. M22]|uniref:glycosyltransferase n=1 Tax=Sulfitobacter sp. M22 TaxID=2675332 RepID=UPI001F2F82DC|nr:glycosyltransferase [Sulfitobacter sp. M22]MCF7728059.1 glycosyltransferase [Sulfitobacter sp. M22]